MSPISIQCQRFFLSFYVFSHSENLVSHGLSPHSWMPCSSHYCHCCTKPYTDVSSPQVGSEALPWIAAPTPTGQLPCSAPRNVFWIELGMKGGRTFAFSLRESSPQLPHELPAAGLSLFRTIRATSSSVSFGSTVTRDV